MIGDRYICKEKVYFMITAEYFLQKHKKDFVECYFKDYTYTNFMKWSQKDEH